MLAYKICEIFAKGDNVNTELMRKKALTRHDPNINANELLEIYKKIKKG